MDDFELKILEKRKAEFEEKRILAKNLLDQWRGKFVSPKIADEIEKATELYYSIYTEKFDSGLIYKSFKPSTLNVEICQEEKVFFFIETDEYKYLLKKYG